MLEFGARGTERKRVGRRGAERRKGRGWGWQRVRGVEKPCGGWQRDGRRMVPERGSGRRAKGVGGCKVQSIARLPSLGSYSTPIEERYRHDRRAVTIADSLLRTGFELSPAVPCISCPWHANFFPRPSANLHFDLRAHRSPLRISPLAPIDPNFGSRRHTFPFESLFRCPLSTLRASLFHGNVQAAIRLDASLTST